MLFNHDHRIAFIHIPRTGGTSIKFGWKEGSNLKFKTYGHKHYTWNQQVELNNIPKDLTNWFIFAIHRDPYERAVSQYYHTISIMKRKLVPESAHADRLINKGGNEKLYKEKLKELQRGGLENYLKNYNDNTKKSQAEFIRGVPKDLLQLWPFKKMFRVGYFLKTHRPQLEYLPWHTNQSGDRNIKKIHTKNTISYINDFYAEDFTRFGYKKITNVEDFRKIEL